MKKSLFFLLYLFLFIFISFKSYSFTLANEKNRWIVKGFELDEWIDIENNYYIPFLSLHEITAFDFENTVPSFSINSSSKEIYFETYFYSFNNKSQLDDARIDLAWGDKKNGIRKECVNPYQVESCRAAKIPGIKQEITNLSEYTIKNPNFYYRTFEYLKYSQYCVVSRSSKKNYDNTIQYVIDIILCSSKNNSFVMNDAWRDEKGKQAMLNWNLTALTYMSCGDWEELFNEVDYKGDYYWFFAE